VVVTPVIALVSASIVVNVASAKTSHVAGVGLYTAVKQNLQVGTGNQQVQKRGY